MNTQYLPRPEQIRAARSLLGWSQSDLAVKSGVAISTIADFERGQRIPIQNNAIAIRRALETAGVQFTENSVSHGLNWTFMTERGTSTLEIIFAPESSQTVVELTSIFGEVLPPKVSINLIQCATPELKNQVVNFVDLHSKNAPHLFKLRKLLTDMADGEFFLLLPTPLTSTAEELHYGRVLQQLNHPQDQPLGEYYQLFDELLARYDMTHPRTDKHFEIGNHKKKDRVCRFCQGTIATGAKFNKIAHAMPVALGNKFLKLADECDDCNQYFGDKIEPTLIELLSIQRVFLGIESRGGHPTVQFDGGKIYRSREDENKMIVATKSISHDSLGMLTAKLGTSKRVIPQNFYRALAKIALSVIPAEELPSLKRTVLWIRQGVNAELPLPKIASAIVTLPPDPSAQIALYIRREPDPILPHVVCEFRLGCFIYVFVLPFSDKDKHRLIDFFDEPEFKKLFKHYAYVSSWSKQDYSFNKQITVTQNINIQPRDN